MLPPRAEHLLGSGWSCSAARFPIRFLRHLLPAERRVSLCSAKEHPPKAQAGPGGTAGRQPGEQAQVSSPPPSPWTSRPPPPSLPHVGLPDRCQPDRCRQGRTMLAGREGTCPLQSQPAGESGGVTPCIGAPFPVRHQFPRRAPRVVPCSQDCSCGLCGAMRACPRGSPAPPLTAASNAYPMSSSLFGFMLLVSPLTPSLLQKHRCSILKSPQIIPWQPWAGANAGRRRERPESVARLCRATPLLCAHQGEDCQQ